MIVYGVLLILVGLGVLILPDKMAELWRLGEIAGYSKFFLAVAGAIYIAAGVWVAAAGRDPLRHICWVKFAITKCILTVVVNLYAIAQGYVVFSQVGGEESSPMLSLAWLYLPSTHSALNRAARERASYLKL